jgi:uncharacterized cupredoxin-like copper-binding protein
MDTPPPHRHRLARLVAGCVAAVLPAAACGADAGTSAAEPLRSYTVALSAIERGDTYSYVSEEQVDLRAGDEVTFEMDNAGLLVHDLVVIAPDGSAIAAADPVAAGQTATLVVQFEEPGRYRLRCNVDDHLTVHDMQVFVEVKNADGTAAA